LKLATEPSVCVHERLTSTTALKGALGTGVIKMFWAEASGVAIAMANKTKAGRENAERI
jgi:hypothetical protein